MAGKVRKSMNKKEEKVRVKLAYGCLSDSLEKQVNKQRYTLGENARKFENCKEAASILRMGIMLPDGEYDKILRRLNKKVVEALIPIETRKDKKA